VLGRRVSVGRRHRVPRAPGIDLTPMVDVVFLLIIFFMVSTTFITLETGLPVDLPRAQSAQAQPSELPTITVTRDERVFLAGAEVAMTELVVLLQEAMEASGQTTVVLRADEAVPHGFVVEVMDLIRVAGAQRIAIATGG
jgi:biopolymer transport protein ExbD